MKILQSLAFTSKISFHNWMNARMLEFQFAGFEYKNGIDIVKVLVIRQGIGIWEYIDYRFVRQKMVEYNWY